MENSKINVFIVEDYKPDLEDLFQVLEKEFSNQLHLDPDAISSQIDDAIIKITRRQKEGKIDLLILDLIMYDTDHSIQILDQLEEITFEIFCITSHLEEFDRIKSKYGSYLCGIVNKRAHPKSKINSIKTALEVYKAKHAPKLVQIGSIRKMKLEESKQGSSTKHITYLIDPMEIVLIESDGNYKVIALTNPEAALIGTKEIRIKTNWFELEEFFKTYKFEQFMRVHDSYMVNLSFIASFNKGDNLLYLQNARGENKDQLSVSIGRKYKEAFRDFLNGFASPKKT